MLHVLVAGVHGQPGQDRGQGQRSGHYDEAHASEGDRTRRVVALLQGFVAGEVRPELVVAVDVHLLDERSVEPVGHQ